MPKQPNNEATKKDVCNTAEESFLENCPECSASVSERNAEGTPSVEYACGSYFDHDPRQDPGKPNIARFHYLGCVRY